MPSKKKKKKNGTKTKSGSKSLHVPVPTPTDTPKEGPPRTRRRQLPPFSSSGGSITQSGL